MRVIINRGGMKRIVGVIICVSLFAAGMLVGVFALGGQQSVEGSVPVQVADPEGWFVTNFISAQLNSKWERPFLQDDCGTIISNPGVGETALIFVRTETVDFFFEYPNRGSRVTACAGFTAFFPPASSGRPPQKDAD